MIKSNNKTSAYETAVTLRTELATLISKELGLTEEQKHLLIKNDNWIEQVKGLSRYDFYSKNCKWLDSACNLYGDVSNAIVKRNNNTQIEKTDDADFQMVTDIKNSIEKNKSNFCNTSLFECVLNFLTKAAAAINLCNKSVNRKEMIDNIEQSASFKQKM